MSAVAEIEYNLQEAPQPINEIECHSSFGNFASVTFRNSDYMAFVATISKPTNSPKEQKPITQTKMETTFLGVWDEEKQEDKLSPSEINSISLLNSSFKKELSRIKEKKPTDITIDQAYEHVSKKLFRLPFQKCAIEISSDQSLKFTLVFSGEKILMLTKHIKSETFNKNQVLYSYFIHRNLIASDVTDLEEFTKNFKGYITL